MLPDVESALKRSAQAIADTPHIQVGLRPISPDRTDDDYSPVVPRRLVLEDECWRSKSASTRSTEGEKGKTELVEPPALALNLFL